MRYRKISGKVPTNSPRLQDQADEQFDTHRDVPVIGSVAKSHAKKLAGYSSRSYLKAGYIATIALSLTGLYAYSTTAFANKTNPVQPAGVLQLASYQSEYSAANRRDSIATQRATWSPWLQGRELSDAGASLLGAIEQADRFGVDRDRLHYAKISELVGRNHEFSPSATMEIHTLLTSAFDLFVTEVSIGRVDPSKAQRYWFAKASGRDTSDLMQAVTTNPAAFRNILADLTQENRNLQPLLDKIRAYQSIEAAGGWVTIDEGPTIEPGQQSPRVARLRDRLIVSGDLENFDTAFNAGVSAGENIYTPGLQAAVKKFQTRHGLTADGLVGRRTLAALNVSVSERIQQMELNVERHRWMPDNYGNRYIITNIPDYKLRVVENGQTTLEMPVVVGKTKHKTPVFSAEMNHLVVNTTWTVPRSITNKELVPKEINNPGALQKSGFQVLRSDGSNLGFDNVSSSDWQQATFPYTLRQRPGKRNALGKVKFMMPNQYAIYLHDTPAKKLFAKERRAFSHGCVRVGNPVELANHLLNQEGWSDDNIDNLFAREKTKTVKFDSTIPTHIVYLTSWVDESGDLQFREDIYKHDKTLLVALQQESQQRDLLIAELDQLQPVLAAGHQDK